MASQKAQDDVSQALIMYSLRQQDTAATAAQLTTPISDAYTAYDPSVAELLSLLWQSILGAITAAPDPSYVTGTIPDQNRNILTQYTDLVDAIRQTPNPPRPADTGSRGNSSLVWIYEADGLWSELVGFGLEVRENFNRAPTPPSGNTYSPDGWTNLNSFLAILTSKYTPPPPALDFALYAIWSLRSALETQQTADSMNAVIPGAAAWVDIPSSGAALYNSNRQWQPSGHTGAPAKTGPLWQVGGTRQENGFSQERWLFWQQRFGQIGDDETYSQETRDTCKAAVIRMHQIEGGSVSG